MLIVIACKTQIKTMSLSFNVEWWCGRLRMSSLRRMSACVLYVMSRVITATVAPKAAAVAAATEATTITT